MFRNFTCVIYTMKNLYNRALSAPSLVPRPLSSLRVPLGTRLATLLLSMVLQILSLHYGYKYSSHENTLACYCFSSLSTCICSGCVFLSVCPPMACCTLCYILWLLKCLKDNWLWWSGFGTLWGWWLKTFRQQVFVLLGTHIVQISLRERPRLLFASYFPNYVFYVPNPCVLGTRPVLKCKNGYCCKLELARAKSVLVSRYTCNFSAVGCSQVELPYQ